MKTVSDGQQHNPHMDYRSLAEILLPLLGGLVAQSGFSGVVPNAMKT